MTRLRITRSAVWASIALLWLLITALLLGWLPIVRFSREHIRITVRPGSFSVDGWYEYRNPWPLPVRQGLRVPFPTDMQRPVIVQVEGSDGERIPVTWWGTPHFSMAFAPNEVVGIRVRFTHVAPSHRGTYLLTTTRPWLLPLESAIYELIPEDVFLEHDSLSPQKAGGPVAFRDFTPQVDWTFTWND